MKNYLNEIGKNSKSSGIFFFYFSGHGGVFNNNPYFLLSNTSLKQPDKTAYKMKNLKPVIRRRIKSGTIIAVLDACHSGGTRAVTKEKLKIRDFGKNEHKEMLDLSEPEEGGKAAGLVRLEKKIAILTSSQAHQWSYEEDKEQHGLFTYYLVNGFRGAAKNRIKPDDKVTLNENYIYLLTEVANRKHGKQIPTVSYSRQD